MGFIFCKQCNNEFYVFDKSTKAYCTEYCKKKYYKLYKNNFQEKKPKRIIIKKIKKCKHCKKNFMWKSKNPNKIYCNSKCSTLFYKNKHSQEIKYGKISSQYYKLRFEIFKRDNFTCQYCGRNVKEDNVKLHCDHIYPKSKGGKLETKNLTTSCEECNLGKRDFLLTERFLEKTSKNKLNNHTPDI